ncbi:hypothetical protein IEO21_07973 [Rhodonia placenta]|uniref:Glycosyltransferase 2-like domain-containing protein n=1 Tax=Rhodonia placenta TaxID=104341 RepID=A0A8H7NX43_9APHY|nr:hypothetical protein IEO21_07973 [Postia placenta]
MDYDAYDALLHHIFKETQGGAWFKPSAENVHAGVCLRIDTGRFRVFPYENPHLEPFEAAVRALNPVVAVKIRSAAIHAALSTIQLDADAIFVDVDTRIQILVSVAFLPRADKEQCAAFIRDERVLIVWSYSLDTIVATCRELDEKLIQLVWKHRSTFTSRAGSVVASADVSYTNLNELSHAVSGNEVADPPKEKELPPKRKKRSCGLGYFVSDKNDVEKTARGPSHRPVRLFAPIYSGVGAALSVFFIASGVSIMIQESVLDGTYTRFALLATAPFLFCFFSLQIVTNVSYVLGPVAQFHENSKYYSAIPPAANKDVDANLPHITIELPVYKESLNEVIAPSVYSLKKAMQTYARQGGTSAIFVHDDGLQLLSEPDRAARVAFYADNNIGWVARPAHDNAPDGFKRAGRSLRVGEIILIVDSDTVVPEDCLRDAARELYESPEVAIIQHESDVMQVAHHYFENGIAHFTRRINKCISMGCANGEVAPFVGHNAFLRWSALQDAAFVDAADGVRKIWSEANVSEDFDMALRLQLKGYIIRWSTYSEGGFKEGVSLTCDDELNRWQKYAYGCNELIFNPLIHWWRLGPINKQLRIFIWSAAPVHYKFSMLSYGLSADGIAAAALLATMNYFLLGWGITIDGFYEHSFEIWLACTVVFPGAGNLGFTLLEYRLGQRALLSSLAENLTWVPFFFFFFGGLPIHLSAALLAHLFSYNITWGATKKEVERSNFWQEVPRILARFGPAFSLCLLLCAAMVVLSLGVIPSGWQIPGWDWAAIFPIAIVAGCHILFPIILNPWLMIFSY